MSRLSLAFVPDDLRFDPVWIIDQTYAYDAWTLQLRRDTYQEILLTVGLLEVGGAILSLGRAESHPALFTTDDGWFIGTKPQHNNRLSILASTHIPVSQQPLKYAYLLRIPTLINYQPQDLNLVRAELADFDIQKLEQIGAMKTKNLQDCSSN